MGCFFGVLPIFVFDDEALVVEVDEICEEVFVGLSAGPEFYLHCFAVALPNELFLILVVVLIHIFFLLLALDLLDQHSRP